ncbi:hypothetical protein [Campylobacter massiliensis]|uniref:hypothetical protein n=1 Tax=Campylobacter massiliensis TaxID=2762557 RepID=UPI001C8EB048|nr:hypothetical protein [Campylobacter massiliensis]
MQENFLYKYCKTHGKVATNIIVAVYFLFALGIFIVPGDILSCCEICREFVNFMKQYFPNIQIFSNVSPFKEEIEFYTSYMWVLGLLWAAEMAFYVTCIYTVFMDTDIDEREDIKKLSWKMLVFRFTFGLFAIYVYYTGYIVTGGVSFMAWNIKIDFATKFEIFQYISLFQSIFSAVGIYLLTSLIYILYYKFFSRKIRNDQI